MASRLLLLVAALTSSLSAGVAAQDATIVSLDDVPDWQAVSLMHLQLTPPESEALTLSYEVYPLTAEAGLNATAATRTDVWIRGNLIAAENRESFNISETIVFLSCDPPNSTEKVNQLVEERPKAILLYSLEKNLCGLRGSDLGSARVFTMAASEEAADTINTINTTARAGNLARATITGAVNPDTAQRGQDSQNGSNSAVAMSILYSITGLITLLFLVIIGTGAIRAHRYPERYGPRSGYGGRPRQSRAKGLARAVLETLPIVKFGDPTPAKPDPALELESQQASRASPEPSLGTRLSAIPEEPQLSPKPATPRAIPTIVEEPAGSASPAPATAPLAGASSSTTTESSTKQGGGLAPTPEDHLGCSICTEDFTVGEDVRVLPCDHKFHPSCIDPWLVNVSGTCPLCRLDLRPQSEQDAADDELAPPLAADWHDHGTTTTATRRRSLRILDLHRLRHASVEERIEILRRHRTQQREAAAAATAAVTGESQQADNEDQRGRRSRLADRLRDKFRVRTTTGGGPSS